MQPDEIDRRLAGLRARLDAANADYDIIEHQSTYMSAEDGVTHGLGTLEQMAPTFILKTKQGYVAAIISGATRLVYKQIKRELRLKDVSLASPDTVLQVTGSEVGTVSLIVDAFASDPAIPTLVDRRLLELGVGYGGCGVPRHTLRIDIGDLVRITGARVFDFTKPKS